MKKSSLLIAVLIAALALSACGNDSVNTAPVTDTPEATEPQDGEDNTPAPSDTELENDTSEEESEQSPDMDQEVNVPIVKLNESQATEAYTDMIERMKNESPVDIFDDMLVLLPKMPERRATILFSKFDTYMQEWALSYSEQMYFEESPLSGLDQNLNKAFDYTTQSYDLDQMDNDTHKEIFRSLRENGFKFVWMEGSPYPIVEYSQMKVLKDSVPEEIMAFILVLSKETDSITSADAALLINWNELADRIVQTETAFRIIDNEDLHNKLEGLYRFYVTSYLIGMNNTPVVDGDTNKVLPEVLESYEKTAAKNASTEIGNMTEQYLKILMDLDYKLPYDDNDTFQSLRQIQNGWIDDSLKSLHGH